MVVLRARLTPELGAVVQRALEAASERLYHESTRPPLNPSRRRSHRRNGGRTRWHCSPSRHSTTISIAAPVLTGTRS